MRSIKIIALFALLASIGVRCGSTGASDGLSDKQVNVAVSANLRFVMDKLKTAFEEESGIQLEFSTASSGVLASQIEQGAPFDLFLSANMEFPQKLYDKNLTSKAPKVYAAGMLVMWSKCEFAIPEKLEELPTSAVKTLCIANPKHAPYGKATVQALENAGVWDALNSVEGRIIYGESVGEVNQKTMLCAVDVGISNKSVLFSPDVEASNWVEIDTTLYTPIQQGIVITKHGAESNPTNAQRFYDFVFSEKAREILKQYGYKA